MNIELSAITVLLLGLPPASTGEFSRGDVNSDGEINLTDPIFILQHLFLAGDPPPCEDAADVNDDGALDLSDAVFDLDYLFGGGPRPPWPGFFYPGYDGTPDDPFTCGDEPGEIALTEEEVFERLTRSAWIQRVGYPLLGSVTSYAFQMSGRYFYCRFSDTPEDADSGFWNFEKTTAGGGVLILDGKSVLHFSFRSDGRLRIVNGWFEAGKFVVGLSPDCELPPLDCDGCTRAELPGVALPPRAAELVSSRWFKANDFNTSREPTDLELLTPGRYTVVFRGGECSFTNSWSFILSRFIFEVPDPDCDFRQRLMRGTAYRGRALSLESDSLNVDGEFYFRAGSNMTQGVLLAGFDRDLHPDTAFLAGTYERPFRRGANVFRFRARPLGEALPYREITFARLRLLRTPDGYVMLEDSLELGRVAASRLESLEFTIDLAAPETGSDFRYEVALEGDARYVIGSFIATLP